MRALRTLAGSACAGLVLSACSGGSNSGTATVSALAVPAQVNLVDAQGSTSSFVLPEGVLAVTYDEDPTEFWIRDDSMEALNTVNIILCSVQQTGFDDPEVLNAGPYVALVGCEERGGERGGRGSEVTVFNRFVVDSKREDDTSPHIVDFWFDTTAESGGSEVPAIIYGKITITESPSDTLPYGNFELHFKQLLASQDDTDNTDAQRGYLKTVPREDGQAEFAYFNIQGDVDATLANGEQAFRQRARLVGAPGGTAGRAYSESRSSYNQGTGTMMDGAEYFLQFNSDYMARKRVSGSTETKVFDRNDFSAQVYRYGLYDSETDERVDSLSGFSIETLDGAQGWVGYYGMWFPEEVTITNGQALVRPGFGDDPDTDYTAVVVPGRLERRSRETSTLANIVDEDLEYFDTTTGSLIRVRWDGSDFVQNGSSNPNGGFDDITPVSIAGSFTTGEWVDLFHPTRGGLQFLWPDTISDSTETYSWVHSTVTGSSDILANGNLSLQGYWGRLKAEITSDQANFQMGESPFFADAADETEGLGYVFDSTTLMLTLSGSEVRLADGVSAEGGPGAFGFETGSLFLTPLTSLGESGSRTESYVWRTGPNDWNQLRTVKDADGEFVEFDAPLRLNYTHDDSTDAVHHNKTFQLEWTGTDLAGIPFYQEDSSNRWSPGFNIPSGTVVTAGQQSYRIKQLEGEQMMNEEGSPTTIITAQGFDLDTTLEAPTDEWEDPAIGPMPEIDTPAVFVEGVRQTESSDDE